MAVHGEDRQLCAVRLAQWQISHSFHHMRLWLKAVFMPAGNQADHDTLAVEGGVYPFRLR